TIPISQLTILRIEPFRSPEPYRNLFSDLVWRFSALVSVLLLGVSVEVPVLLSSSRYFYDLLLMGYGGVK
ncbi:hypothetical protein U1Q18_030848, partial [Sarracenia purpurea var. burkii]